MTKRTREKTRKKVEKLLKDVFFDVLQGDSSRFDEVLKDREELRKGVFLMKTPKKFIRKRPGKAGRVFSYVPGGLVIRALHLLFGGFSFETEVVEISEKRAVVRGTLKLPDGRVLQDFGTKEAVPGMNVGDMLKSASTDALKRCARLAGVFLDLWIEEEKEELKREEEPQEEMEQNLVSFWLEEGRRIFVRKDEVSREEIKNFIKRVEVGMKTVDLSDGDRERLEKMLKVLNQMALSKILEQRKNE